ncbi:MAG: hypothetical protein RSE43_10805, partial [Oscillospiraceae bacterium]
MVIEIQKCPKEKSPTNCIDENAVNKLKGSMSNVGEPPEKTKYAGGGVKLPPVFVCENVDER